MARSRARDVAAVGFAERFAPDAFGLTRPRDVAAARAQVSRAVMSRSHARVCDVPPSTQIDCPQLARAHAGASDVICGAFRLTLGWVSRFFLEA